MKYYINTTGKTILEISHKAFLSVATKGRLTIKTEGEHKLSSFDESSPSLLGPHASSLTMHLYIAVTHYIIAANLAEQNAELHKQLEEVALEFLRHKHADPPIRAPIMEDDPEYDHRERISSSRPTRQKLANGLNARIRKSQKA